MPVIQARPVTSGTIAGRPATARLLGDPAREARSEHRFVDEGLTGAEFTARVKLREAGARPGAAWRAVEPAGMDRRRRTSARAVPRRARAG